uniref:RPOL_N domain-containing protein n=2 Tax=Mesocestoides corti TaxID=53468 RepID=A0A5K3FZY5_MESCO
MLRTLDSRRKSSRMEKNLDKGTVVISDAVFELLCRHFAARNDWLSLEKTLNWLQEDGIAPTFNICLASLECIGGLLHLSVKGRAPPKALNNFLSAEERLLHSFLENKVIEVVSLAEKHGINVYSGLLRYPRRKYSLQKILTALLFATPDKQADISFHPATSQLSSSPTSAVAMRVSRALDRAVLSPNNLFSDVFQSSAAMMEAFREQLQLETFGQVPIPPALPCFEQMLPEASKSPPSGKLSDRLTQQRQSLLKEQNNSWRRQLTAAFEGTLQRLKIAHTQGRVTAYPFLKILPKKSYVDMMIQAVDTIVTNSELQHVSRSLFLQRLGERVEAACLVWRKQNAGIIDELAKVYENYAAMFTNSTRSTEHFREMWLRSLQMNAESGVSLDPEWPQWNTHLRLLVGQELYRILYDHLTFDLNGGKVDREPKTKLHQEAPVLFEVMSEQPGDARYEIRVHPTLLRWYRAAGHPPLVFDATELPMLCPPIPWIDTKRAGYLLASSKIAKFFV